MSQDSSDPSSCCSRSDHLDAASAELKLYRAFIFSVPIFFTFILLFLFYVFYLRPRRVDWLSLRMRAFAEGNNDISGQSELGLRKELREMLPIIVYKESFSVKDTQCSVCLLDYQPEDRLQQIPACGHTFHMSCIDLWLANHSTCPLCRFSLLASTKSSTETSDMQEEVGNCISHFRDASKVDCSTFKGRRIMKNHHRHNSQNQQGIQIPELSRIALKKLQAVLGALILKEGMRGTAKRIMKI